MTEFSETEEGKKILRLWIQKKSSTYSDLLNAGFEAGYAKALDDSGVIHGKDAKKFLKKTGLDKL